MKQFLHVAQREIRRLVKGKIYWFCMLIAPLFCAFFFLTLMGEGLPKELPIALVDMDNSTSSRSLARQLDSFGGTNVVARYPHFEEARRSMQRGEIYGIFYIPEHFARDAASGKQPNLSFYTNNSYLIAGSLLFKDMKTASVLASGAVTLQVGNAKGIPEEQVRAQIQPIVLDTHPIGNPTLNYSVYLSNIILPGILSLLIMAVTVYSIGIEIKEKTARQWLATGNNSITPCLMGKLLPHTLIFFSVGMVIYLLMYVVLQFPLHGSLAAMLGALLLLVIASQALGVFMIGCFPTLRLGLSFSSIWGMLAFSMSGFSFPASAMYAPVRALTNLFPLRHYFLIYVDQALNARALFYAWPHYLALAAFLVLPLLTIRNLKFSLQYDSYQP